MKITIERDTLLPVLRRAAACSSPVSAQAGARLMELVVEGATLTVGTTDHVLQYRGRALSTEATRPGTVLVEAKPFLADVELMPAGRVTIELKTHRVRIAHTQARRTFSIDAMPSAGVPPFAWGEDKPEQPVVTLPGEGLAALLGRVMWAADPSDANALLNAIQITLDDRGELRVEAATSSGIASVALALPRAPGVAIAPFEGSLSLKSAQAIAAFAKGAQGLVDVTVRGPLLFVDDPGRQRIGAAMLSTGFRDIRGMIRVTSATVLQEVVVPKKALLDAVSAARTATTQLNPGVFLAAHGSSVHVVAEAAGEAHDEVATATPITATVWGQYHPAALTDAIKATTDEHVGLAFCKALSTPVLIAETTGAITSQALLAGMVRYQSALLERVFAAKEPS
jgi:DNA polymerase III sliding clamp (beta) subunit (PCNA family)